MFYVFTFYGILGGHFPLVMGRRPIALAVAFKGAQYDWANYPNPEDVGNTLLREGGRALTANEWWLSNE